jgi:hypothetical protein
MSATTAPRLAGSDYPHGRAGGATTPGESDAD